MKLIITEKELWAADISKGLGEFTKKKGYYENSEYLVTWAIGHLFHLDDSMYNTGSWNLEELPILPKEFDYRVSEEVYRKNQANVIFSLIKQAKEIIVAGDAGREGELIQRAILYSYKGKLPLMSRFWASETLSKAVVQKKINERKPLSEYDSLYYAAKARQESDWIVGINLTRLFSIKTKTKISIGRVQTPCLALIYQRQKDISEFKPMPYSVINVIMNFNNVEFQGKVFNSKAEKNKEQYENDLALTLKTEIDNKRIVNVISVSKEIKKVQPTTLYSLTLLQRAANRKYSMSAQETLDIAQQLYEKYKVISYPRSDSQYLGDNDQETVKESLIKLKREDLIPQIDKVGKRVFDSTKLTDHYALIPLENFNEGTENERVIYDLIKTAFLACFYPLYIYEETVIISDFNNENHKIVIKGKIIQQIGWRELYQQDEKKEDENLPDIAENDEIQIKEVIIKEQLTKAPEFYSEDTLLSIMDRKGLGTPATRAGIIEKIVDINYVIKEKRNLIATQKGIELMEMLEDSMLKSVELTADWEQQLEKIYKKNLDKKGYQDFMEEIKEFTKNEVNKFKEREFTITREATSGMITLANKLAKENNIKEFEKNSTDYEYISMFIKAQLEKIKEGVPCSCGGTITQSPKAVSCDKCKKIVWKEISNKKITFEEALKLIEGKEVKIKGMKNKKGEKYDAILYIDAENKIKFKK